jgi:hypothetical protein
METHRTIETVLNVFVQFWSGAIYTWVGIGLLVFIWGVSKVIRGAGDPEMLSEGKKYMLWALIGLFVIFSMWGIVELLRSTLSLNDSPPQERIDVLYHDVLTP